MRRSALFAIVVAGGLAALSSGCRSTEKERTFTVPNPLAVTPERPLTDVPVPVGFALKSNGSYVFDGHYRVARLLYRGTPHVEDAVRYFKELMPQTRWTLVRDSAADGRIVTFFNAEEECQVRFDRDAGMTAIQIDIKPRRV